MIFTHVSLDFIKKKTSTNRISIVLVITCDTLFAVPDCSVPELIFALHAKNNSIPKHYVIILLFIKTIITMLLM